MEVRKKFGQRIIALRQERNWTQEDLSASSGISTRSISNIENGIFSITLDTAAKLARSFSVSLGTLFDFEDRG